VKNNKTIKLPKNIREENQNKIEKSGQRQEDTNCDEFDGKLKK